MTDVLSSDVLERTLPPGFGRPFRFFDEVGSTNTEALEWARQGAPEGALVVTNHQSQGRGRWTRTWVSDPGRLLQFSLILRPKLPLDQLGLVTTALGVACAEAIESATGLTATVKWPNDVRVGGRKVAGILVESHLTGSELEAAVGGLGVNVGWSRTEIPDDLKETATSLATELDGTPPARAELLAAILTAFERRYSKLPEAAPALIAAVTERSDVLGHHVVVALSNDTVVEGRANRILDDGRLEVETATGPTALAVGEIRRLR
ncbi:MAG: biotin--[acetyl-CoA-carboxylase] ligase [Actinomycetota bacterium]|nr:biotin--[acetyl-CoA-carboxylase] ligase [Actinomycetota bacterium]